MALKQNAVALGSIPMPTAAGSELVAFRMEYKLTGDVAAGDIIELGFLPADHLPCDLTLDYDDMDTGATGTVSVGLLNAGKTDLDTSASGGSAWLTAQSVQSAGAARADAAGLLAISRVAKASTNRSLGVKIVGDPAAAAGQVIGLMLYYRAA